MLRGPPAAFHPIGNGFSFLRLAKRPILDDTEISAAIGRDMGAGEAIRSCGAWWHYLGSVGLVQTPSAWPPINHVPPTTLQSQTATRSRDWMSWGFGYALICSAKNVRKI